MFVFVCGIIIYVITTVFHSRDKYCRLLLPSFIFCCRRFAAPVVWDFPAFFFEALDRIGSSHHVVKGGVVLVLGMGVGTVGAVVFGAEEESVSEAVGHAAIASVAKADDVFVVRLSLGKRLGFGGWWFIFFVVGGKIGGAVVDLGGGGVNEAFFIGGCEVCDGVGPCLVGDWFGSPVNHWLSEVSAGCHVA